jgi:hypothetical protein
MTVTMKNLTNVKKSSMMTNVFNLQNFEKLTRYELSKVKGGNGNGEEPVVYPD